jgi:branched-chain amino acid aminotransferase
LSWIIADGKLVKAGQPVLHAQNRGFRYGDGLFETMRWMDGKIRLELYHMERLFKGLSVLGIDPDSLSEETIHSNISKLVEANKLKRAARVRLSIYRQENNAAGYVVEAFELKTNASSPPWRTGLYTHARKTTDAFANLKSANFLPYVMATRFAVSNNWDEAFVLNNHGNLADGSRTNVFLIHDSQVTTPALTDGCVNGVMRRHVVNEMKSHGVTLNETAITVKDIETADEIFLTNAIIGIQAVSHFHDRQLHSKKTDEVISLIRL